MESRLIISKSRYLFLFFYLIWIIVSVATISGHKSDFSLSYLIFFQLFIPGAVLGVVFNWHKKTLTEFVLYSFILSYLIYIIGVLPAFFFDIRWSLSIGINAFLYFSVLIAFLLKTRLIADEVFCKFSADDFYIITIAAVIAVSSSYVNFRSDASQYINRVTSTIESEYVQTVYSDHWEIRENEVLLVNNSVFHHDYKPYYSFLALPLKYSKMDQRSGWFIFNNFFVFLSLIAAFSLGKKLCGVQFGYVALFAFVFSVFVLGLIDGGTFLRGTGRFFSQIAYPRYFSGGVLLAVFYISMIDAIKKQSLLKVLFSGSILLCIFTVSGLEFYWASLSTLIFSSILFLKYNFTISSNSSSVASFVKFNSLVAMPSFVLLLFLFIFTSYWQELVAFKLGFNEAYPDFNRNMYKLSLGEFKDFILKSSGLLYIIVVLGGFILLIRKVKQNRDIASIFVLSNVLIYLFLKLPPIHNLLIDADMRMINERLDGWLLFYICGAVMITHIDSTIKLSFINVQKKIIYLLLVSIIFIIFGTNNYYSMDLRFRKNAGYDFLEMTEYLNFMKNDTKSNQGISVLTNKKSAFDVYAFLNAATFQYQNRYLYPLSLGLGRKDIERLLYYPNEQSAFIAELDSDTRSIQQYIIDRGLNSSFLKFKSDGAKLVNLIETHKVDYILIPTRDNMYSGAVKSDDDFRSAIEYYNKLDNYSLAYQDKYYYLYRRNNEEK